MTEHITKQGLHTRIKCRYKSTIPYAKQTKLTNHSTEWRSSVRSKPISVISTDNNDSGQTSKHTTGSTKILNDLKFFVLQMDRNMEMQKTDPVEDSTGRCRVEE